MQKYRILDLIFFNKYKGTTKPKREIAAERDWVRRTRRVVRERGTRAPTRSLLKDSRRIISKLITA
jgi:hypothetical protein